MEKLGRGLSNHYFIAGSSTLGDSVCTVHLVVCVSGRYNHFLFIGLNNCFVACYPKMLRPVVGLHWVYTLQYTLYLEHTLYIEHERNYRESRSVILDKISVISIEF